MRETQTIRPFDTLAPWAEIVPGIGLMTVDDPLALPDDGWQEDVIPGFTYSVAAAFAGPLD
jgi:hypothetical protein